MTISSANKVSSLTQRLAVSAVFEGLSQSEKLYAHHMSKAAWQGARIILQQVSPEAEPIFDFILELYKSCEGEWDVFIQRCDLSREEIDDFLEYAALFLANVGNYYGYGGQKFTPGLPEASIQKFGRTSSTVQTLVDQIAAAMTTASPVSFGYPGDNAQSQYYPGPERLTREEIAAVTKALEVRSIEPENTRVRKVTEDGGIVFIVHQASIETGSTSFEYAMNGMRAEIRIERGDHAEPLSNVCGFLEEATRYASSDTQHDVLRDYIKSFRTGSLDVYRESQKKWVANKGPKVEDIFGFVESYHDPHGVRAEWQGLVAIVNDEETATLKKMVAQSSDFLRLLPWVAGSEGNDGKGPFEKEVFSAPDFTTLAYCSSIIFGGINLPNYNDIRQTCGFKNVMIANRMSANATGLPMGSMVSDDDVEGFMKCRHRVQYVSVAIHELLGHGAGKLLCEDDQGVCNFSKSTPPMNPVTGRAVDSWYGPKQTWTTVFEDIATAVEECRADLVAAYLMDTPDLLSLFGYSATSEISAEELIYNAYLLLGVRGLEALEKYSVENKASHALLEPTSNSLSNRFTKTWGQAHDRGDFGILMQLLRHSNGCIKIDHDPDRSAIIVRVDRSKIIPYAKDALAEMLLKLHIYRCTADVRACRPYFEDLTAVEPEHEQWRTVVLADGKPRRKFVQANTFLNDGKVILKEYEETNKGLIQSWAEREV